MLRSRPTALAVALAGALAACSTSHLSPDDDAGEAPDAGAPIADAGAPIADAADAARSAGWRCTRTEAGEDECRLESPRVPGGGGDWSCLEARACSDAHETVCIREGDALPAPAPGWACEARSDRVECSTAAELPPGLSGPWACHLEGEGERVCTNECTETEPECERGTSRWCEDWDLWGRQACLPDGTWSTCLGDGWTAEGRLADRPDTACGCRYFWWHPECCEDQEDRDGDGRPDCIIPAGHTPPVCPREGGLCSYCDRHTDCGGDADLCVSRSDGYSMCGRNCSAEPCPVGYACELIPTADGRQSQCVPVSLACE